MNLIIASLFLAAATAGDSEAWNAGVEFFHAGDTTNALRVLQPLMLSQTHGPRAAEVVTKLAYDAGDLETAAAAAQIALRAAPDDPKANRNFTRAVDRLPAYREEARLQRILKGAQGQDPGAKILSGLHDARSLLADAGTYRTNAAPRAVAQADRLSARAEKLGETWVSVKELICQSVTNEQQAATIVAQVDDAAAKTAAAARKLGDLDPEGYSAVSDVEHAFNRFAKMTAAAPSALDEGLVAQSNAWLDAEMVNGRAWQPEALDWTRAFRRGFPAWARAYVQKAETNTNMPPFKAEDQARVSALATELEQVQMNCVEKTLPPEQEKALGLINRIRELLPKDPNGGGGQNQQNPNQSNNDQQQNQQDQQKQQDQQEKDQPPDEKQDQNPDEQPPEEDEKDAQADEQESEDEREVEDVLKKAQERSDEHEADKKARMRKAPLPPNERDW